MSSASVAAGEDAGVDARVQRLHAPAEHLRHPGELLDAVDREPSVLERGGGAAARHELDAERGEAARELSRPDLS